MAELCVVIVITAMLSCSAMAATVVQKAGSDVVGILVLVVDQQVAKELQLTGQQRDQLLDLIDAREAEAIELISLPAEQQKEKLAAMRRESETQGLALLTPEQRAQFEKIRLRREGLAALAQPAVIEELKLSEEQQSQVAEILGSRDELLDTADEPDKKTILAGVERKLSLLLTDVQRSAWVELIGTSATSLPVANDKPATQEVVTNEPKEIGVAASTPGKIRFSFRYQPWRDVLQWFADQADLSFVLDAAPEGTFNYTDSHEYTPAEAIDLLNSVLLTKGYTLVRRQRMLMLINLEDGIPDNLISTIPLDELDKKGEYELVAVLFDLEKTSPEALQDEIEQMVGPQGSVVALTTSRQLLVTETAGRLRAIRSVIERIERPQEVQSSKMEAIDLEFALAEELLDVARQMLDIPAEQNATADGSLRLTADPLGNRILVTATPEMLEKVKEIIKVVDVAGPGQLDPGAIHESPQLVVYTVTTADSESVLAVMQTLLDGLPDVRLTVDAKTGNLIALARPSQHKTIKATLDQLQRDALQVEVIHLNVVDPQLAVLSINKLFGAGAEGGQGNAPLIDADPSTNQLLIRGTEAQIEEIRSLLEKMGESDSENGRLANRQNVRMLDLTGSDAEAALQQIQEIWPSLRPNKIRFVTPSAVVPSLDSHRDGQSPRHRVRIPMPGSSLRLLPQPSRAPEKKPAPKPTRGAPQSTTVKPAPPVDRTTRLSGGVRVFFASQTVAEEPAPAAAVEKAQPPAVETPAVETPAVEAPAVEAKEPESTIGADIIVAPGPGGVMIASDDLDALDEFEELLTTLAGDGLGSNSELTVFYLKFAKASLIAQTLNDILGGGTLAEEGGGGGGGLVGDMARTALGDAGGGIMGALLGLGGAAGGSIAPSGPIKITPDSRLNALFVQAGPADVQTIEQLLQVLDQKGSPEDVAVIPKTKMVPVVNTQADEIVEILKQVYSDRLASGPGAAARQPSPQEFFRMLRGGRGGRGSSQQRAQEEAQKMALGVDARSNSVIVAAPEPLLDEVVQLIKQLDQTAAKSDQTMRVVTLRNASPEAVQRALSSMIGDSVQFGGKTKTAKPPTTPGAQPQTPQAGGQGASDAARRAMMMQMMRSRGQGGGGRGGRGGRR